MMGLKKKFCIILKLGVVIFIYYILTTTAIFKRRHLFMDTSHSEANQEFIRKETAKGLFMNNIDNVKDSTSYNTTCNAITLVLQPRGEKEAIQLFWLLKSLLFYRTVALKLHIFADVRAYSVLQVMFETWELPCVQITYHNYTSQLMKSHWKQSLEQHQEKVIYLSPEMRILSDIKEFYHEKQAENTKLAQAGDNHITSRWIVKPELKNLINITYPGQLKAFASQPEEDIYIASKVVMNKVEELFEVLKLDGNIYRHPHLADCHCGYSIPKVHIPHSNISLVTQCSKYVNYAYSNKRTLLYVFGSAVSKASSDIDVSVVTQLSYDRIHILERFASLWRGPMVVVIYITDSEAFKLQTFLKRSAVIKGRTNIDIHLVFKRKHLYPINQLRNVGLKQVKTPYCVFIDVDLLPNPTIYEDLKRSINDYLLNQVQKALVIPTFEAFDNINPVPANKTVLLKYLANKQVDGYKMGRKWNLGHKPTDYPKWKSTNEAYIIQWRDAFEPYVVLKTSEMPLYEPALLERMGDKIAYGLHLYAKGFEFRVLPDVYVIHMPHPTSDGTSLWKHEPGYFSCGAKLMQAFKRDIFKVYPSKKY